MYSPSMMIIVVTERSVCIHHQWW